MYKICEPCPDLIPLVYEQPDYVKLICENDPDHKCCGKGSKTFDYNLAENDIAEYFVTIQSSFLFENNLFSSVFWGGAIKRNILRVLFGVFIFLFLHINQKIKLYHYR
jgi:hypothetical protein